MGNEQSKPNRKIPIIHPSKLKNTIFGDASKMFGAPAAVNTHRPTTKVIQQQQQQGHPLPINRDMGTNNQIAARTTDTNRNVALQRLQVHGKVSNLKRMSVNFCMQVLLLYFAIFFVNSRELNWPELGLLLLLLLSQHRYLKRM